jgi:excinuclease ABC subunit C
MLLTLWLVPFAVTITSIQVDKKFYRVKIMEKLPEIIKNLPENTGVYIMKNAENNILYIGKAINIKSRVKSYFTKQEKERFQIPHLIAKVQNVEFIVCESETEALILEADLVRRHKPPYNILLKDDKYYPYVKITKKTEKFGRIIITRRVSKDKDIYFGPFTDTTLLRFVVISLRKILKIRSCNTKSVKVGSPCINFAMKLCNAPCNQKIDEKEYADLIEHAIKFFSGRHKDIILQLKSNMAELSSNLEFEKAAQVRDMINSIKELMEKKYQKRRPTLKFTNNPQNTLKELAEICNLPKIPSSIEAFDISNTGDKFCVAGMVNFTDGRPNKSNYRRFKIKTVVGQNDFAMLAEAIIRRLNQVSEEKKPFPDLFLIDGGKGQLSSAQKALSQFENPPMLISIAEKEELIISPYCDNPEIRLAQNHPVRRLVQIIRDEVHRFAVSYHRKIRGRQFNTTILQDIKGIGPQKAQLLLKTFGSVREISKKSLEDLSKIKGISKKDAENILEEVKNWEQNYSIAESV